MTLLEPIQTVHLFAPLEMKLVEILKSLSPEDWESKPLPHWTVKDIAAHLLDTSLRRVSMVRDGYFGETFTGSNYQELVVFLNRLNADWVSAFRRVSPKILVALIEQASRELIEHLQSLDPDGPAAFPITWAGEEASLNWFDIAREYTERWHHQQQIREVVGRPGIMTRELYYPVLDTFMRVLPHTYRDVAAAERTTLKVEIVGESGGTWYLTKGSDWNLSKDFAGQLQSEVEIPQQIAWKLFTKGVGAEQFQKLIIVRGDDQLATHLKTALAIMA